MRKLSAFFIFGLLLFSVGCHTAAYNDRVFGPWGLDGGAAGAKACWDNYTNIFMVCIYEDHWEDRGPGRYSLLHYTGTVVKIYKGDWRVSERIAFVQGLDYRAPTTASNTYAGDLGFIFTNQHTNRNLCKSPET